MSAVASYAAPLLIAAIILSGLIRRVPLFDTFTEGAWDGMRSLARILPSLVGLVTAVQMLQASGAVDTLTVWLSGAAHFLHLPAEVVPLVLLRPVSGSGSIALLNTVLADNGPDSPAGRVASVMLGSSETTFYAVTVYFGAVKTKRIGHTILAALVADVAAALLSGWAVELFFH